MKRGLDRRSFLITLASSGALAACSTRPGSPLVPYSSQPLAAVLPHTGAATFVVNNATKEFTNAQVYYYLFGLQGSTWMYLKADGSVAPVSKGVDFSIQLSTNPTLPVPKLASGRIIFSLGKKLTISVNEAGAPVTPVGWVKANNPNYDTFFDFMEFTYDSAGLGVNTTMVDMFSLPMTVHLTGSKDQKVGPKAGARPNIFQGMRANDPFGKLIVPNPAGGPPLRVIAPGHGILAGVFPADYLDAYITKCWDYYKNNTLKASYPWPPPSGPTVTATGKVDANGKFRFMRDGQLVRAFDKPLTRDAFFCDGALLAPNDEGGKIAAILGAGFNRTNLYQTATAPKCNPSNFYDNAKSNFYSKVLHNNTINGVAYGFAFDDVCNLFSTYISDPSPKQLEITLGAFA